MTSIIVARLNAKLGPIDRGDVFEDPLLEVLEKAGLGEVSGGGTQLGPEGEIKFCELEIVLDAAPSEDVLRLITGQLEALGAPRGSLLLLDDERELPFGTLEGLGLYLNGTDLPKETYATSDVNFVIEEINRILAGTGSIQSFWEGPSETALYMYGKDFHRMSELISPFVSEYPLCQQSRIEQIA